MPMPRAAESSLSGAARLTLTALVGLPIVAEGDDLAGLIVQAAVASGVDITDDDVLVIAQKVVSKAEGRFVSLASVVASQRAEHLAGETGKDARLIELILSESTGVVRSRKDVMIVAHRLGMVMANAGIDASNVEGADTVLLLPRSPDESAARIRDEMRGLLGVRIGVVISDSVGRAWRLGTVGTAIGVAGISALADLRGSPDLNGRILRSTEVGVADELASAASLLMGQADEGRPVIHVRGFPYAGREGSARDLLRPVELDLFR